MENAVPLNSRFKDFSLNRTTPQFTSLADQAYEHILTQIVYPDDKKETAIQYAGKITESKIAKDLNISTGPVREAIIRLRYEGWVQTIGKQGSFFIDFSDPKIAIEIYRSRLSFEVGAFYCLANWITNDQVDVLRHILEMLENAKKKKDIVSFRKADTRFHLQVAEFACGPSYVQLYRPKLMQWFAMAIHVLKESKGEKGLRFEIEHQNLLESLDASTHHDLFESLAARDTELAVKLISQHQKHIAQLLEVDNYRFFL